MKPAQCQRPSQNAKNNSYDYKEVGTFLCSPDVEILNEIYLLGSSDQFEPSPIPLVVLVLGSLNKSLPVRLGVKVGH